MNLDSITCNLNYFLYQSTTSSFYLCDLSLAKCLMYSKYSINICCIALNYQTHSVNELVAGQTAVTLLLRGATPLTREMEPEEFLLYYGKFTTPH